MVGRPRSASDESIFDAAVRVISRVGPGGLTLAEVAREAGLSASALVQRFGSKRGLLLAIACQGRDTLPRLFADARTQTSSPLEALLRALTALPAAIGTPQELANHLAFLEIDLSDDEFHALALEHALAMRGEIRGLLDAAVRAGELVSCDTARYARAVQATYNGALMTWAMHREGALPDWLRTELATLLGPLRAR